MTWHKDRFTPDPKKTKVNCICCGKEMFFPASKANLYKTCGDECREKIKQQTQAARQRSCLVCGKSFVPRLAQIENGVGFYCSRQCSTETRLSASLTKEAREKRLASYLKNLKDGKIVHLSGENNPRWKGGFEEMMKRRKESGTLNAATRKYRKNNPEKVREFSLRRKSRKFGRLAKGTIKKIGNSQNWRCVVCTVDISEKYHLDHIVPLAKGGKHEETNVQLLCPTCNVRKSAKDPIQFMQENGFLL